MVRFRFRLVVGIENPSRKSFEPEVKFKFYPLFIEVIIVYVDRDAINDYQ